MSDSAFPKVLYHYTTVEGLMGILKEKALWATKIQYLNDATELAEPIRVSNNRVNQLTQENMSNEMLQDLLQWIAEQLIGLQYINFCVVSFCADGDLLSQWRGYGISGSSYSIGFDTAKLREALDPHPFELKQCNYYDKKDYESTICDSPRTLTHL